MVKDEAGNLGSWWVLAPCPGSLRGVWRLRAQWEVGPEVRGDFSIFLWATARSLDFTLTVNDSGTNQKWSSCPLVRNKVPF